MAGMNKMRALNRLPYDFEDGLKIAGVDVTTLNQMSTANGAGLVGFTPVGNLGSTNVQAAIAELDVEKVDNAALAASAGSSLVGYDGGTVQAVLDSAKPMADYTALRAYAGRATQVRITSNGIAGFFYRDDADTTSADNGGTVIVSAGGKRWKRHYDGAVNIAWFGAKGDWGGAVATDNTEAIQQAANSSLNLFVPLGAFKTTETIILRSGTTVYGENWANSGIFAYGCNAFMVAAGGTAVNIEKLGIYSYSAAGLAYPKLHVGISSAGANGNTCSWINAKDVYLAGWYSGVDWQYTWNSVLQDVQTAACEHGVRLFGQSVNNFIYGGSLSATAGASVNLLSDGAVIGEGLMISNCLLVGGQYGILGNNGFLALEVSNCVIDLIQNTGIQVTDPRALTLSNTWIYAENYGVKFPVLGVFVDIGASINGCHITTNSPSASAVLIEGGNGGVTITGGSLKTQGGPGVIGGGFNTAVTGVNIVSDNAYGVVFAEGHGAGCVATGNTGNNKVSYFHRGSTPNNILYGSAIQFPTTQVPSSDANTLDDYEEGTWIPVISADGLGVTTFTAAAASGSYVKVGRAVTVTAEYTYSDIGAVGGSFAIMSGLPFVMGSKCFSSIFIEQTTFDTRNFYCYGDAGYPALLFRYDNGSGALYGGSSAMLGTSFPASGSVKLTMTYLAIA